MKLRIERGLFKDEDGHTVVLRGINVAGDAKFPRIGDSDSLHKSSSNDSATSKEHRSLLHRRHRKTQSRSSNSPPSSFDDETQMPASYVGSPFPLDEADEHFARLRSAGFNVVRYIFTWDALEHQGPGIYDDEYIDFTIEMLKKLSKHGLMAFMDPHQDTWSRFSGGSGAPLWTLHAAGLNHRAFNDTLAAILCPPTERPPIKMLWASNYHRLACQLMYTLFFAGEDFAPHCQLDGVNIGEYLRQHYLDAISHFAAKVAQVEELRDVIIGWESMNEPGHGLIGYDDIGVLPSDPEHVKLGCSPTPLQAMLLGQGIPQTVEAWTFTAVGGRKTGTETITPSSPVWLSTAEAAKLDEKYGWTRSWEVGCIWQLHGVYKLNAQNRPTVLKSDYFTYDRSGKPLRGDAFVQHYFVQHWFEYEARIRALSEDWFVFMQTPVNNSPPDLRGGDRKLDEKRTVYTPHYYDGMTLMLKRWKLMNVDAIGVIRKQYVSPVLAVRIGERAIRSCLVDQLRYLKAEGQVMLGDNIPCLISEIGIPYDMEGRRAYSSGNYSAQIRAMDAHHNALEQAQLAHTLWVYTANNSHSYGDMWNGEDFSIWSKDDLKGVNGNNSSADGFRAAEAVVRPFPRAVSGSIVSHGFDMQKGVFTLTINCNSLIGGTTTVFLPEFYFPGDQTGVSTTSGTWERSEDGCILTWKHFHGTQTLRVRGIPRASDAICRLM